MPDLNAVFAELRSIMAPYAAKLDPKKDDAYVNAQVLQYDSAAARGTDSPPVMRETA